MTDSAGAAVEITDFAPRFVASRPHFLPDDGGATRAARRRTPAHPRARRPAQNYGQPLAATTHGSNHIRYVGSAMTLRLTSDAPVTAILEENPLFVDDAITFVLGPDETLHGPRR